MTEFDKQNYPEPEKFNRSFLGKDVLSVEQFTNRDELELIFDTSREMRKIIDEKKVSELLVGHVVCSLFYQPSSRTFSSFSAAAKRLGAIAIEIPGMEAFSSVAKGENLADTVRSFRQTTAADIIVLRHPEDDSSFEAAKHSEVPIINAGSGRKEHPTQAILDIYTIQEKLGKTDDLTITFTGDLRNGRTVKSLAFLLGMAGNDININFMSPDVLKIPEETKQKLFDMGVNVKEGSNGGLADAVQESDILYVTRVQREWFEVQAREDFEKDFGKAKSLSEEALNIIAKELGEIEYKQAVEGYVIDERLLENSRVLVMHPLPRLGEISREVDDMSNAIYFPQMRYGLESRMALLALILGKGP